MTALIVHPFPLGGITKTDWPREMYCASVADRCRAKGLLYSRELAEFSYLMAMVDRALKLARAKPKSWSDHPVDVLLELAGELGCELDPVLVARMRERCDEVAA